MRKSVYWHAITIYMKWEVYAYPSSAVVGVSDQLHSAATLFS